MDMKLPPFQELVDAYWRDVARLSAALAGPGDADDAAQRAWVQALAAYPSLRHARNLRGWLLTVAARAAIDGHRQLARRPLPLAELPDGPAPAAPPAIFEAEGLWERVRRLPERQRIALALRYVLDLPHAEIARELRTTQAASRRLVSDALATLRAELREDPSDQEVSR
jgi:RNA polymerase sigma factor (sigma-70 family)